MFHCGDAYATVVSVDTKGNPVELPFELRPDSPADKLRCAEAAYRSARAVGHAKSPLKPRAVCIAGHISCSGISQGRVGREAVTGCIMEACAARRRDERLGMRHALLMNEARRPSLDGSLASARHHHERRAY